MGFVVQYTPAQNDQRPNILADEESNPAFATFGYHQKDYNIYTWALMNQIDLKLNSCGILSNASIEILSNTAVHLFPNPTNGILNIKIEDGGQEFQTTIFNQLSQILHKSNNQNQIDLNNLPNGIYFVTIKTSKQIVTKKIIKASR